MTPQCQWPEIGILECFYSLAPLPGWKKVRFPFKSLPFKLLWLATISKKKMTNIFSKLHSKLFKFFMDSVYNRLSLCLMNNQWKSYQKQLFGSSQWLHDIVAYQCAFKISNLQPDVGKEVCNNCISPHFSGQSYKGPILINLSSLPMSVFFHNIVNFFEYKLSATLNVELTVVISIFIKLIVRLCILEFRLTLIAFFRNCWAEKIP